MAAPRESAFDEMSAAEEAIVLELRSRLMHGLQQFLASSGMGANEAAKMLRITEARISDLRYGRLEKFDLRMLIRLAMRAGLTPTAHLAS